MKKSYLLYIGLAAAVLTTSCRKYVEIPIEQQRTLELTSDYEALLNNTNYMLSTYSYICYSSDETGIENATWENGINNQPNGYAYTWAEKIIPNNSWDDNDWVNMYRSIYITNQVVTNVMDSKGGNDADKRRIQAAGKVHRAFYYHTLASIYARQYDSATAAQDLGLPMRFDDLISGSLQRGSVQAVYDRILSDLNDAIATAELPDVAQFTFQASKAAAYGMLARVYLHTRNFSAAKEAAGKALQLQGSLLNLNNYISTFTTYPQRHVDPEILFCKTVNSSGLPLSPSQRAVFADSSDLRYRLLTAPGASVGTWIAYIPRAFSKTLISNNGYMSGPTVPEMMLIQAECEARAGNASAATTVLNNLRKQRFTPADYRDIAAASPAEAMQLVIAERRRELMNTGHRWFDLRRLAKDGLTPTITHKLREVTYTLEPNSNRYVYPIADKYIQLNPEIQQNPR